MRHVLALPFALLLACCSGNVADEVPTDATDITDALFTNRSATCAEYADAYVALVTDLTTGTPFTANVEVSADGSTCSLASDGIPNHDFGQGGSFANAVAEQDQRFTIPANPQAAASPTPAAFGITNGVMLNGVKLDLYTDGCFGVGDGNRGCGALDTPYRYDALGLRSFGTDTNNAHVQPGGLYHYHGDPKAMYAEGVESPVIGFAADGFPIFGPFIEAGGAVRRAESSYQLKSGARPTDDGGPGGTYDGTFIGDYEYVEGSGDLDACNGMTHDGVYGYYVTEGYPYVVGCFVGTPDASFRAGPGNLTVDHSHVHVGVDLAHAH
ncbi:MAG: YHYH protein [Bacteroidota bacterium]